MSENTLASEKPIWAEKLNKTGRKSEWERARDHPFCFLMAFTDVKHQPLTQSTLLAPDAFLEHKNSSYTHTFSSLFCHRLFIHLFLLRKPANSHTYSGRSTVLTEWLCVNIFFILCRASPEMRGRLKHAVSLRSMRNVWFLYVRERERERKWALVVMCVWHLHA